MDVPESGEGAFFADTFTLGDARKKLAYAVGNRARTGQPFFLAVGLRKPHLDFRIPKPFYDQVPTPVRIAEHRSPPKTMPEVAYHGPYRSADEEKLWKGWGYTDPWTPMRNSTAVEMRRHYYAAVAFMDSIVGELLATLDASGIRNDTAVVLFSDHGWALGESNMWRESVACPLGAVSQASRSAWLWSQAHVLSPRVLARRPL